jgi:hypothetical protein
MTTVTTTRSKPKPFAWSYSRLKNYESCPKRHWHIDIAKDAKESESESLLYGNAVHDALANRVGPGRTPLPEPFKNLEPWADRILKTDGKILVEQQLAITKDYAATTWFGSDAWYRGIADVLKIVGPVALAVDWKTGKILEDGVQLALMAQCVFAHHPEVQKIRTEFIWLKEDATTRADFSREDMVRVWAGVLPRVQVLENAYAMTNFPPKPGSLCRRWCPVTQCPHQGQ